MKKIHTGIYQIRNRVNNKVYVGSAFNIHQRWACHLSLLTNGKHKNKHLQNAWNKYESSNFCYEILEEVDKPFLIEREQFWIDKKRAYEREWGYNLSPTAGNTAGVEFTTARRDNISIALLGKMAGEKNPAAKINLSIAAEIREDYKSFKYSQKELAKKYSVSVVTVQQVLYNKIWIDEEYSYKTQQWTSHHKTRIGRRGESSNSAKLNWRQVKEIRNEYSSGSITMKALAEKYKVSVGTIQDLIENQTWYDSKYVYTGSTRSKK